MSTRVAKERQGEVLPGDIIRKRKFLEHQREGTTRMKQVGTTEIPQEALFAILEVGEA